LGNGAVFELISILDIASVTSEKPSAEEEKMQHML